MPQRRGRVATCRRHCRHAIPVLPQRLNRVTSTCLAPSACVYDSLSCNALIQHINLVQAHRHLPGSMTFLWLLVSKNVILDKICTHTLHILSRNLGHRIMIASSGVLDSAIATIAIRANGYYWLLSISIYYPIVFEHDRLVILTTRSSRQDLKVYSLSHEMEYNWIENEKLISDFCLLRPPTNCEVVKLHDSHW
jgi:hypothetical protein